MNKWLWGVMLCAAGVMVWPEIGRGVIGDTYAPGNKIQIQVVDNAVRAVRSSGPLEPFGLSVDEHVLTVASRGAIAAVITSDRFLAISETSSDWLELPFNLNEGYAAEMALSENMAIMNTQDRVVGFDGVYNRLIFYDLPAGERVFARAAGLNVMAFATEYRAVGAAAGGDWEAVDFAISEIFRALNADADLASVQTSTRLMTFSAADASWSTP